MAKRVHERDLVCGSLVTMVRTCGNPNCRCARGEKHVSLYLSVREKGRRKMIYIPSEWEATVRSWVQAYRETQRGLEVLSEASLARWRRAKARGPGRS